MDRSFIQSTCEELLPTRLQLEVRLRFNPMQVSLSRLCPFSHISSHVQYPSAEYKTGTAEVMVV